MINNIKFLIKRLKKRKINVILNNVTLLYNPFFQKKFGKTKKYRVKSRKQIRKYLFRNSFFKPSTFFYFKKIVNLFQSYYKSKFYFKNIIKYTVLKAKKPKRKKKNKIVKAILLLLYKQKIKSKLLVLVQKKIFVLLQTTLIPLLKGKSVFNKKVLFLFYYYTKKFFLSLLNQKLISNEKMLKDYYIMGALKRFEKKPRIQSNIKLYNKLLGLLIKKGNKKRAITLLNNALSTASKQCKCKPNLLLKKILIALDVLVEAKKVKKRRSVHFVPFPLKKKRKLFKMSQWLLLGAKHQIEEKSFENKLSLELVQLIKNKNCFAYKFKRRNILKALQNKSNAHFRW